MPDWLGITGIVLGALGLALALVGRWMRRRENAQPAGSSTTNREPP